MRYVAAVIALVFALGGAAEARKRKKHKFHRAQVTTTKRVAPADTPNEWNKPKLSNAEEHARAEADLADLRSTRDVPLTTLQNQAEDDEAPGQKRRR